MILNFKVKNFRSVKEEAEISFTASVDKSLLQCLIPAGKKNALPLIALYGENSSGKSTLIQAFVRMREMICGKYSSLQAGEKLPYEPFAFSEMKDTATEFEVEYIYENIRYMYSFSYNADEIIYEKLYFWPNGRESLIFSREGSEYVFRENFSEQNNIAARTLPNRLYIKTSSDWKCPSTLAPFSWFVTGIICADSELSEISEESWREELTEQLKFADPMVCGIPEQGTGNMYDVFYRISGTKIRLLPVEKQSGGFVRYHRLAYALVNAMSKGVLVIADEFDSNLSERLTRHLVELVQSPELNPNHAQLLCATHDTSLMDQSLIRRDQIYLTEKLNSDGSTVVHPVTYFSPRKDKRIDFGYKNGEFRIEVQ